MRRQVRCPRCSGARDHGASESPSDACCPHASRDATRGLPTSWRAAWGLPATGRVSAGRVPAWRAAAVAAAAGCTAARLPAAFWRAAGPSAAHGTARPSAAHGAAGPAAGAALMQMTV